MTVFAVHFPCVIRREWIMTEVGEARDAGAEKPWVPERVRKALESATDFGDFRNKREFTFLHVFSGKTDILGEEICKVASDQEGLSSTIVQPVVRIPPVLPIAPVSHVYGPKPFDTSSIIQPVGQRGVHARAKFGNETSMSCGAVSCWPQTL